MKKLFLCLLLLASSAAEAQFVPGQLLTAAALNTQFSLYAPLAGATFTGVVNAPTGLFTNLTVTGVATLPVQAANTFFGNASGSSASPSAFAAPSCSTSSSALQWVSGTGLACNTAINASTLGGTAAASYALLASPTFTGTPSAPTALAGTSTTQLATTAFVSSSPTITTPDIAGVSNGVCANAGLLGECKNSNVPPGSAVPLSDNVAANVTSVSLTAGNWLCSGNVGFSPAGTTITFAQGAWISTTSAALPTPTNSGGEFFTSTVTTAGANGNVLPTGTIMINVSSSATAFLGAFASFTTSTESAYGYINCIRYH